MNPHIIGAALGAALAVAYFLGYWRGWVRGRAFVNELVEQSASTVEGADWPGTMRKADVAKLIRIIKGKP